MLKKTQDTVVTSRPIDVVKRKVTLCGQRPIMFDRYAGDNDTKLDPEQKLYLVPGSKVISLPAINFMSLLTAHNTNSAPKRLRDKRKYKDIANACLSFVEVEPDYIPFIRDGGSITFDRLIDDHDSPGIGRRDPSSGVWVDQRVARLDKGIPNPKLRPVLPLPWSLTFTLTIFPNAEIKEQEIKNLIADGGRALGLGTFRGSFGKFAIEEWE